MKYLYLDESGELGAKDGSSKYFLITVLCTEHPNALRKRIKKQKAKLYNAGWPRDIEIKGTTLWGSRHYPGIPSSISDRRVAILEEAITSIVAGPVSVHYSIVKKARLSEHLLKAPYGITFNFLAGTLLVRAYPGHFRAPITLIVDQRSKEAHNKTKFDGYVETRLITDCNHMEGLEIRHEESHRIPNLQAVDLLSWGLFRYYEHNDPTFKKLIAPAVGYRDQWYPGK